MYGIYYAHARFNDLELDTRSQWIGRGKQYLNYDIQTAHDGRLAHDKYAHILFDDLELFLDFDHVCKARPSSFFSLMLGIIYMTAVHVVH